MAKKHVNRSKLTPFTTVLLVVLVLYSLILFFLLGWALLSSFKSRSELVNHDNYFGLPENWTFYYADIFNNLTMNVTGGKQAGFFEILGNSILYAVGSAFLKTLVPTLTAYACARFHFKTGKAVYTAVLLAMIIPIVGSLPSELTVAYSLGIVNQIWGSWILKASMTGLYFFVLYSAFKGMPDAYFEAARIDGANNFHLLFRIALPLVRGGFWTIFLINFVTFWNDYQTPMIYLKDKPTLGYTLWSCVFNNSTYSFPMTMTLTVLVVLPILILFLIFKDKLMGNLTMGGIKG